MCVCDMYFESRIAALLNDFFLHSSEHGANWKLVEVSTEHAQWAQKSVKKIQVVWLHVPLNNFYWDEQDTIFESNIKSS